MNFAKYPVDLDNLKKDEVKFRIGISPKYKPSKAAVAAAFRSHSADVYTSELIFSLLSGLHMIDPKLIVLISQRVNLKQSRSQLLSTTSSNRNFKKFSSLVVATTTSDGLELKVTASSPVSLDSNSTELLRKLPIEKRKTLPNLRK
jgi:hypothetical protein